MNIAKYLNYLQFNGYKEEAATLRYILLYEGGTKEAIAVTKELIEEGKLPKMPEDYNGK